MQTLTLNIKLKRLCIVLGFSFAIFTGFWSVLSPLGGMAFLLSIGKIRTLYYIFIAIISLLIATSFFLTKELSRKKKVDDIIRPVDDKIIDIGNSRVDIDYLALLQASNRKVQLLGLSLPFFSTEAAVSTLKQLIQKEIHIYFLVVNPLTRSLSQRPQKLYSINIHVRCASATTLLVLSKLKQALADNYKKFLEIRVTSVLPSVGSIRFDDKILWSPYLMTQTGATSPYFLQEVDCIFGRAIAQNFESLWDERAFEIEDQVDYSMLKNFTEEDSKGDFVLDSNITEKLINILKE